MSDPAATTAQGVNDLFSWLNSIGTIGLAFIVFALMRGWLITRREFDALVVQRDRLEEKLDHARVTTRTAVQTSQAAIQTSDQLLSQREG